MTKKYDSLKEFGKLWEKGRLILRLEPENTFLREQIERLLPLALPPPRRWWLAWYLPARGRAGQGRALVSCLPVGKAGNYCQPPGLTR